MILEGSVDQEDAMGLNDDLREKGFALLCVAYPKSDLNIIIGKEVIYIMINLVNIKNEIKFS